MIDLRMEVRNGNAIKLTGERLNFKRAMFDADLAGAVNMMRGQLEQALEIAVGPSWINHFGMDWGGNKSDYWIRVFPKDDVGRMMLEGAKGPYPIGEAGQTLENEETGVFGPVAGPVMHPGYDPKRPVIQDELRNAAKKIRVMMTR